MYPPWLKNCRRAVLSLLVDFSANTILYLLSAVYTVSTTALSRAVFKICVLFSREIEWLLSKAEAAKKVKFFAHSKFWGTTFEKSNSAVPSVSLQKKGVERDSDEYIILRELKTN